MLQYEINEEVWLGRKTAIERSIVDRVLRNAPIEGVGLGSVAKEHNERQVAQHRKQQLRYSSQVVFDFRVSSNSSGLVQKNRFRAHKPKPVDHSTQPRSGCSSRSRPPSRGRRLRATSTAGGC